MKTADIVKDEDFQAVTETKVDTKNRLYLGVKIEGGKKLYKVYRNSLGQIFLDPLVTIPASEEWLFENKIALNKVREGIEDAKAGRVSASDEDYTQYSNDPD